MVKLFCAIVGGQGSAFSVTIDASDSVDELKKAIKKEKENDLKAIDPDKLELFLAKKGDAWLTEKQVEEGISDTTAFKPLKVVAAPLMLVGLSEEKVAFELAVEDVEMMNTPIHVLVVVPEDVSRAEAIRKPKLTTLAMLLKQSEVVGDLPQTGGFLKLFEWTDDDCGNVVDIKVINDIVHFTGSKFYVRKEILCVLENFKLIYHNEFETGELVNKQFILMGSPGTGKSCILALICFYIAVYYKRPVVWFRHVVGGLYPTTTRLLYQGKYYEWTDIDGEIYDSLYVAMKVGGINPINCWFCLDGMCHTEINNRRWFNKYKLLATSGQFSPKAEVVPLVKMCLVPYWKQTDLEDFGLHHMQMQDIDVDARFYLSGGSLREFLNDDATTTVKSALDCIGKPEDAENLLTMYGVGSNKQIDRIRMRGVQDRNNAKHYVNLWKWTSCVMSRLALHHLTAMMKPNFFEKLMGIAKGMNDDRLEGVAFEGYFHTLVRHRRSFRVHFCKYDNVDRRIVDNWNSIMRQQMGSIECNEQSVVKCDGGNMKECVAVMESWAANPSKMDYWIPATSLCETIDAVAKWTLPGNEVRFCFLQLTKAITHKCKASILWELARPFVDRQLPVCYIALLPDEDRRLEFRLSPVQITKKEVVDHIPLYVAHFELLD